MNDIFGGSTQLLQLYRYGYLQEMQRASRRYNLKQRIMQSLGVFFIRLGEKLSQQSQPHPSRLQTGQT